MKIVTALAAVLMLGAALPAVAQMPPPPMGGMPDGPPGGPGGHDGPHGKMFASMSEAGRIVMMKAMRDADPRGDRQATMGARDRMLTTLGADRLDVTALRRAMDEEREASTAAKLRHQTAMLAGFQKLSLADRRAFVSDARAMQVRMDARMAEWRGHHQNDMMPPPQ